MRANDVCPFVFAQCRDAFRAFRAADRPYPFQIAGFVLFERHDDIRLRRRDTP